MPAATRASLIVVAVGGLWGLYWAPLRRIEGLTGAGPWITVAVLLVGTLCLLPAGWRGRARLRAANQRALASTAAGGGAFVLYSNALLYGDVAVVILLFYLTPIWSTLIARFWLRWPVPWGRYAAIGFGLAGIALVLRGSHGGLPLPQSLGDWLGLASGMLWSIASTGIHTNVRTRPAETNFVFLAGGTLMALLLAVLLGALLGAADGPAVAPMDMSPADMVAATVWTLFIGALWWAASMTAFMWANGVIEPTRVGILLMSEVIVGAASAALFTAEPFGWMMAFGGVMVVTACVLETLVRSPPER